MKVEQRVAKMVALLDNLMAVLMAVMLVEQKAALMVVKMVA